jgi:hypothetical protein
VIPTGLFLLILFSTAVWEMLGGYYTRFVLVSLYLILTVFSMVRARKAPFFKKPKWGVFLYGFGIFAVIGLGVFNVNVFRA